MRIRVYKKQDGWHSKILRSKGGPNSLVIGMISNNLFQCLKIFTLRNLIKAYNLK